MKTSVAALSLSLALCLAAIVPVAAAATDIRRDAVVAAVAKVRPSVVNISTEQLVEVQDPFDDWFLEFFAPYHRRQRQTEFMPFSLGSGVVVDEEGYILTNHHVVQRADRIVVLVGTNRYEAKVEAGSPASDIALLKIQPREKLQPIQFGRDDDLLIGETVIALGNPFGLGISVSRGILSSTARRPHPEQGPLDYQDWLQTDAAVNPGNSGGPLINLRGELIGINNAVFRQKNAQGISFAIPIKRVGESLSQIFTPENKGYWFGARIQAEMNRLTVHEVQPGSPAEKAGLKPGDRVMQIGETKPQNFVEFMVEMIKRSEKRDVPLTIVRGSERRQVAVKLVREETVFNAELIRQKIGATLEPLTPEVAGVLGYQPGSGLVITSVDKGSPAAAAGLQPGIVVTSINGRGVNDVVGAARVFYDRQKNEKVTLGLQLVQQRGAFLFAAPGKVDLRVR